MSGSVFRRRQPKRLVLLHHQVMEQSIEGIWLGMVGSHYHLTAAKIVSKNGKSALEGDLLVPASKVTFLQILAQP